MKDKTTLTFLSIVIFLIAGCNSNSKQTELKKGFYQLKLSDHKKGNTNDLSSQVSFTSAILHVKDNDSLEFKGNNNIAKKLWGHDKFEYRIAGSKIVLSDKDFVKKVPFSITKDSLLKLEVNTENFINLYFNYLTLSLKGKYGIAGFEMAKNATSEDAQKIISVVERKYLKFSSNDTVTISAPLAQLFTKNSSSTDSIFKYQIQEDNILLVSNNEIIEIPFIYDGVVRLFVCDDVLKRLDLYELKE